MTCEKTRYDTGAQARRALAGIKRFGQRLEKKPTRAYQCPHCHGWHLTSDPH
jgi:hypothetical protein